MHWYGRHYTSVTVQCIQADGDSTLPQQAANVQVRHGSNAHMTAQQHGKGDTSNVTNDYNVLDV